MRLGELDGSLLGHGGRLRLGEGLNLVVVDFGTSNRVKRSGGNCGEK